MTWPRKFLSWFFFSIIYGACQTCRTSWGETEDQGLWWVLGVHAGSNRIAKKMVRSCKYQALPDWNWAGHQRQEWEGETVEMEHDGYFFWYYWETNFKANCYHQDLWCFNSCEDFAGFSLARMNMLQDAPETLLAQADCFWWAFFFTPKTKQWKHLSCPPKPWLFVVNMVIILPSYMFEISHYKDPYKPITIIMECHSRVERCRCWLCLSARKRAPLQLGNLRGSQGTVEYFGTVKQTTVWNKKYPPLKLTANSESPWKWMVGRWISFFGKANFQVRTVSFREGIQFRGAPLVALPWLGCCCWCLSSTQSWGDWVAFEGVGLRRPFGNVGRAEADDDELAPVRNLGIGVWVLGKIY